MNIEQKIKRKESILKGRIAESLVKELFIILGIEVYHHGIEHQFPHLAKLYQNNKIEKSIALENIATQPDFIISNNVKGTSNIYRVEVKFRISSQITTSELLEYDEDVIFILLDTYTFYAMKRSELETRKPNQKTIKFQSLHKLSEGITFPLDNTQKRMVYEFSRYVPQYLGKPRLVKNSNL